MTDSDRIAVRLRFEAGLRADPGDGCEQVRPVSAMFRPYSGSLDLHRLAEVLELAKNARRPVGGQRPNLEAAHAIWVLTSLLERWVLDGGGMLQRNKLISAEDTATVRDWLTELGNVGLEILEGSLTSG